MSNVKSHAIYAEIMPSNAVECKRYLLETELHLLNILKTLLTVKELRRIEFNAKAEARVKMKEVVDGINKILFDLPISEALKYAPKLTPEKEAKKKPAEDELTKKEAKEKSRIEAELLEIKKKLEQLSI